MLDLLAARARGLALRGALGFLAIVLVAIGLVFLGMALWIALTGLTSPLVAALILAGGHLVFGAVLLALALRQARRRQAETADVAALIEAFAAGMKAGRAARS